MSYVYQPAEPGLYTVGYYDPAGKWIPESDHATTDLAAERVRILNGGTPAKRALPPDPDKQNNDRANWAQHAIDAFARVTNMDTAGEDQRAIFGDLLGDLLHWCDRNGLDFDAELAGARRCYQEETEA